MSSDDVREAVYHELASLSTTVEELGALLHDVEGREPTIRERTAAGAFLAQFYSGVENVLRHIARYHGVPVPAGETWHLDLFVKFCHPPEHPLPLLFDQDLARELGPYRRFRHVVHHGYGFELRWDRMHEGIRRVPSVFRRFDEAVRPYLSGLV